ncbi:DUF885 family protein [Nocardioides sp. R-C-SC26]|uniref:DUF885 domain-containing protein n=1 Tax=Nocardioides sp. R-C-SC26 TaxID=2870414 RepID=UPI001E4D4DA0|nr:DUF885 domain-containing protein [Nocardioides sp. R-C-SC26]
MSAAELDDLAATFWDDFLRARPTEAHLLGDYRFANAYERADRASEDADVAALRDVSARAAALDDATLDAAGRLTRDVLAHSAASYADVAETRLAEIDADPIFGPQVEVPIVLPMLNLPDRDVAAAMADKLRGVAQNYRDRIERLREGLAAGRTPAAFAVADSVEQLDAQLASTLADSPVVAALPAPPESMSTSDAEAWREQMTGVGRVALLPAMADYRDALRDVVLPRGRSDERCGLGAIPDGDRAYATMLRFSTTTDLTAQQIHDLGVEQVARLAEEYRALGPAVVGSDDLATIFDAMRHDPALHFTDGQQMVTASEVAMARAWEAMPAWFEVLPQAPCAVQGTESGPKAFYFPPSADGSRGGTFFINTDDPGSWGTFELESMAFHEGIPGHHLQLTIAAELAGVPEFRKHLHNNAYAEGWGLYTERLADEMGLYSGPIDRIGMLAADSMRACRLVVDTGLHALGWSRDQAVRYMVENSPLAEAMVRPEIDRYICTPGQATSYMVGRLEIQRIRAAAEARQGARFDIRAFHSAVLDNGSLPLGVLDEVVRERLPA